MSAGDAAPMPSSEDETSAIDASHDHDGNGDNSRGNHGEAGPDEAGDIIEPLPDLPHDDYGRKFDVPAPSAPMEVAKRLYRPFRIDAARTLLSWRTDWMGWRTTHWAEVDPAQLRSHAYRSLSGATYEHVTASGVETRPWNPDRRKIGNTMAALAALAHVPSDIDAPSWICAITPEVEASQMISCANGLLDLERRTLVDHTPLLFNFVSVPFDYDPAAVEPVAWLEFLTSLWPDDQDSIMLLQEYAGYVLSGRTDMHKMLTLIGPIRGGKGTIARTLTKLIGKGNVAGPTLASLNSNFGLSPLLGKPLAIIADARLGSAPSHTIVERLLSITGEDMLTIDRKYREPWTGRLPTRFIMLSNELPRFPDSSGAIATRMLVLQLNRSFLNREDRTIESRLAPELPAILNWALDGLDRLTANGSFTVPESSKAAATMMMDLASPVSAFVRERCELGADKIVGTDLLYCAWMDWADSNGHRPGAKITFGRSLHAAVPGLGRADISVGNKRVHGYRGIGLLGGPDSRTNKAEDPARPAQNGQAAGQNGSNNLGHSAPTPDASLTSGSGSAGGAQDGLKQHRSSGHPAQDAQDAPQSRPDNGDRWLSTTAHSKQEHAGQFKPGKSRAPDFALLRKDFGIEPGDPRVAPKTGTAADAKATAPARINGRPIDHSAHYKAPAGARKRKRRR